MMKRYPKDITLTLICDLELTSEDIDSMSRSEAFEAILDYEGYVDCASKIKRFVLGIYGIDLDNWQEYLDPESVAVMEGLGEV